MTSRMMPPPSAVTTPRVSTPMMSRRADRTAVRAPLRANAKVPVRSRASSSDGSVLTGHSFPVTVGVMDSRRVGRCRPSCTDDEVRMRMAGTGPAVRTTASGTGRAGKGSGMSVTDELLADLDKIQPWHLDFYQDLHRHPELSF